MRDDTVYLRHIRECIRRIEEDVAGGKETFLSSHTLQDAVLRNLQTMSESAQRLSDAVKMVYPQIEWRRISAFRNVLVHNCLGVDLEIVWQIVQHDVPELRRVILAALDES